MGASGGKIYSVNNFDLILLVFVVFQSMAKCSKKYDFLAMETLNSIYINVYVCVMIN